jgi:hypothetical protein
MFYFFIANFGANHSAGQYGGGGLHNRGTSHDLGVPIQGIKLPQAMD